MDVPLILDYLNLGQSIWLDSLSRSAIKSGELQSLVDQGVRGVTANPTIFEKAIVNSTDYDEELKRLATSGRSEREILETLMIDDVAMAADLLRPTYDALHGADGFVSIEVNPELADDTEGMIDEASRFVYKLKNRPNIMIKIPATKAGFPAVRRLTAEGVNINITLIFSVAQYGEVTEAYLQGLEELAGKGADLTSISSVASFFVSRVDTMVDKELQNKGETDLRGKIGISNAKVAYTIFKDTFSGARWERLKNIGARVQRPLWASTSTKNPSYPDTLYIDSLIGPDTINTVPPETLSAALDHGKLLPDAVELDLEESRSNLERLSRLGIDIEEVAVKLEDEGIEKFSKSYETLLASIRKKKAHFQHEIAA